MSTPEDRPPQKPQTPRISKLAWGRIEVEGADGLLGTFKDAKVYPGGAREWDWRETGTHHVPGIQPADVAELVTRGATTVVLSKGVWERLEVPPATLDWLQDKGVEVRVLQTEEAVECFNALAEIAPVGGLFHSTC